MTEAERIDHRERDKRYRDRHKNDPVYKAKRKAHHQKWLEKIGKNGTRMFWREKKQKGAKMENLNAENIINEIQSLIKALKDCGGWVKRGNGEGWFNHEILVDALALINSQEQRIKELAEECKDFEIRALRAENEAR